MLTKDGRGVCFQVPESLNCLEFDEALFRNNKLSCVQCASEQFVLQEVSEEVPPTLCLQHHVPSQCEEQEIGNDLRSSSFRCRKCRQGFFLDKATNTCQKRQHQVENCRVYQSDSDNCEKCDAEFYFDRKRNICRRFPTGILNCSRYSSLETCQQCQPGYYLQDNKC